MNPSASADQKGGVRCLLRKHTKVLYEILIFCCYLTCVVAAFCLLVNKHATLAFWLGLNDKVELDLSSISSIIGIMAAALAVIISNRQQSQKELQTTRDQIYQQLELESIQLFRFEIDNTALSRITWGDTKLYTEVQDDPDLAYQVLQHICQILNLFEMAVRFRRDGIIHEDVFKSWMAWMYDLCASEIFLHYWYLKNLNTNYIELFQDIIDRGLCCVQKENVIKVQEMFAKETTDNSSFADFREYIVEKMNS